MCTCITLLAITHFTHKVYLCIHTLTLTHSLKTTCHHFRWLLVVFEALQMRLSPKVTSLDTMDTYTLLQCISKLWDSAFNPMSPYSQELHRAKYTWFVPDQTIGRPRDLLFEIRGTRNRWAHQETFTNQVKL
jgi:hypothetical protein